MTEFDKFIQFCKPLFINLRNQTFTYEVKILAFPHTVWLVEKEQKWWVYVFDPDRSSEDGATSRDYLKSNFSLLSLNEAIESTNLRRN